MLGAIVGDIVGSVYERNNLRSKLFMPLFHPNAKFTDDTVCTVVIADALLNNLPPAVSLRKWGRQYWSNGGWGERFAYWLASDTAGPYNSFGNGAAMRVSPCAWLAPNLDEALALAVEVTEITHNHEEGLKGVLATTTAISLTRQGLDPSIIKNKIEEIYHYELSRNVDAIRLNNPHSDACQHSVPEAITCALEATSFEDAIRNAISIGGDSDTIAAIAGSIAEAQFGIPDNIKEIALTKLPPDIKAVVIQFYEHLGQLTPNPK
jgi:ADP-ribosylglycohydrolase